MHSFSFHSTSSRSEMMQFSSGCVLGLAIAFASVSSAHAFDQAATSETLDAQVTTDVEPKAGSEITTAAEITTDAETSVDAAADTVIAESKVVESRLPTGTGSLSVDPTGDIVYPAGRPEWLDQSPTPDDKPAVWPIKSLLSSSPEKAQESLEIQVQGAMAAYAELALKQMLGDEAVANGSADRLIGSRLLQVDLDSGVVDRYSGTVKVGGVTRYEEAARLTFDKKFDRRLERAWKAEEVEGRLGTLGVVGGVGVCLLMAGTGLVRRIARKHNNT